MDPLTKPEWRAGVNQVLGQSWTPYTPILTATTTNPTGWICTGNYYRVGALITATFRLTPTSTSTAGTGSYYYISLPVPAARINSTPWAAGNAYISDGSSGNGYNGFVYLSTATLLQIIYPVPAGSSGHIGPTTPWTWASGDDINGIVTYEAAAST